MSNYEVYSIKTTYNNLAPVNTNHSAFKRAKELKTGLDIFCNGELYLSIPYEYLNDCKEKKLVRDRFDRTKSNLIFYYDGEDIKTMKRRMTLFDMPKPRGFDLPRIFRGIGDTSSSILGACA
jgi:hypothetical protein